MMTMNSELYYIGHYTMLDVRRNEGRQGAVGVCRYDGFVLDTS